MTRVVRADAPTDPAKRPLELAADPAWSDLAYGEPNPARVRELGRLLRSTPDLPVVLYHGTDARHPIREQGLLPSRRSRAKSLQSRPGYVSLSIYPDMARTFGEMGNPGREIAVYRVTVAAKALVPDRDQLANQRRFAGRTDLRNTLAESLAHGHGAQVPGPVPPYRIEALPREDPRAHDKATPPPTTPEQPRRGLTFPSSRGTMPFVSEKATPEEPTP